MQDVILGVGREPYFLPVTGQIGPTSLAAKMNLSLQTACAIEKQIKFLSEHGQLTKQKPYRMSVVRQQQLVRYSDLETIRPVLTFSLVVK